MDRSLEPVSTSLELFEPTRDSSHLGPNYFIYSFRWFLWTLLVLDSLLRAEDKIVKLTEIIAPIGNGGGKRQIYLLKFKWKVTGRISFSLPGSLTLRIWATDFYYYPLCYFLATYLLIVNVQESEGCICVHLCMLGRHRHVPTPGGDRKWQSDRGASRTLLTLFNPIACVKYSMFSTTLFSL